MPIPKCTSTSCEEDITPEGKRRRTRSSRRGEVVEVAPIKVGYGKAMSSPWELPPGGISGSPAWQLLLQRCGGAEPPVPEERLGAPVEAGFPVSRWPPNVLVDCDRVCWLPDDWGQGVKNTGPGGTYIVWVSPQGGIFYHRPTIERSLGRELTVFDSCRGRLKSVQAKLGPCQDSDFFEAVLTAEEKRYIMPAESFHFCVISARRAKTPHGAQDIMLVEAQFRRVGVFPTWYVDAASVEDYCRLGLNAIVGGKLTPARNMALDDAERDGKVCVQISDDISRWEYFVCEKLESKTGDFSEANAAIASAKRYQISPVAAGQFLLTRMRTSGHGARLGGVYPTANAAQAVGQDECTYRHFILGDFFVAEGSPCRFDPQMTLKEDYDYTASHLATHGAVLRCNRLILHAKHSTNEGGAVAMRDDSGVEERKNIAILQKKWPGAFHLNGKRKDEVIFTWAHLKSSEVPQVPAAPSLPLLPAAAQKSSPPAPPAELPVSAIRLASGGGIIKHEHKSIIIKRAVQQSTVIDVM